MLENVCSCFSILPALGGSDGFAIFGGTSSRWCGGDPGGGVAQFYREGRFIVRKLLEKCGSEILEIADNFGWMPLHYAAHLGNVNAVKLFLKTNGLLGYIKDSEGMSALHMAAKNGQSRVVKELIEERPDVCELVNNNGQTALHVAVDNGWRNVVETLLKMEAFSDLINEQDDQGNTSLHLAAIHGLFACIELLANDKRMDKGVTNKKWMTALDIARLTDYEDLSPVEKLSFISPLTREGGLLSLERTVVKETRMTKTNTSRKERKISHESDYRMKEAEVGNIAYTTQGHELEELVDRNDPTKVLQEAVKENERNFESMTNLNLLAATIIASITYSAAIQVPGGYNNDGIANLKSKASFQNFLVSNSMAFRCSASAITMCLVITICRRLHRTVQGGSGTSVDQIVLMLITFVSTFFTIKAFKFATDSVLNEKVSKPSIEHLPTDAILQLIGTSGLLFFPILYFIGRVAIVLPTLLPSLFLSRWLKELQAKPFLARPLRKAFRYFFLLYYLSLIMPGFIFSLLERDN
ncbi:Transmembrane protein [Trema orientale]|uniref:Transmembrane protein n=1 Tax=Trema orientale TaxID=63057 RepID=A0A2P5FRG6_TREOI|nr:Transmembrane protein [Trema orientale]